jgi:hypothetical protein
LVLFALSGLDLFAQQSVPAPRPSAGTRDDPTSASIQAAEARRRNPSLLDQACCEILQIPASSFNVFNTTWTTNGGLAFGYYYPVSTAFDVVGHASLTLPERAIIQFVDLYYDDPDPANDMYVALWEATGDTDPIPAATLVTSVFSSGSAGKSYAASTQVGHTVNNNVNYAGGGQYILELVIPAGASTSLGFKGVDIWWERQVSPAPASADFGDVPTSNPYFQFIEALYAAGVTAGCGGGNFCPDRNITRKEVATWMAKALGLDPRL